MRTEARENFLKIGQFFRQEGVTLGCSSLPIIHFGCRTFQACAHKLSNKEKNKNKNHVAVIGPEEPVFQRVLAAHG
jgi:hypothetical protein